MADKEEALMGEAGRRSGAKPKQPGSKAASREKVPPAGPHAKPELIDKEKTPGSGVLDEPDQKQTEAPTG